MTRARTVVILAALALALGCGKKAKTYPDTVEGLRELMTDLRDGGGGETLAKTLEMKDPKAWFAARFGDEASARLTTELKDPRRKVEQLPKVLKDLQQNGRSEMVIERFEKAEDPNANGVQTWALQNAKTPLVLYSVRLTPPGKPTGVHIYSFVYDGGFRFAGPMKTLNDKPASPEVEAVAELRNKDREEFFKSGKLPGDE
jgi:hypothetical protein